MCLLFSLNSESFAVFPWPGFSKTAGGGAPRYRVLNPFTRTEWSRFREILW